MKKYTYHELWKLWGNTFPGTQIFYCLYEFDEEDDDIIYNEVDFTSAVPLLPGEFTLTIPTWNSPDNVEIVKGVDLTWKKLVDALDTYNDGAHIFWRVLI